MSAVDAAKDVLETFAGSLTVYGVDVSGPLQALVQEHEGMARDLETYWGRSRLVTAARRERDAMRDRAIEAEAKLDAVRALIAPEATLAAMVDRGFADDGPVDATFLAAFGDYSIERTAAIRKVLS